MKPVIKLAYLMAFFALLTLEQASRSGQAQSTVGPQLARWLKPQDWKRDTPGPILSLGAGEAFDNQHIHAPAVAQDGGRFLLWYAGSRGSVADRVFRLGLATSHDGRTFERHAPSPVLQFADGRRSVLTPNVLTGADGALVRDSGRIRMWFSSTDFHDPTGRHTLHESSSDDGVRWSTPSEPQLEHCYAPTVVKHDGQYLLWYTDVEPKNWRIRHARSDDGRTWTVDDEPSLEISQAWESGRLFYPTVVKVDGGFVMWYGSYWRGEPSKTALGCAVSVDGRRWVRSDHNPVFRPDPERSWEANYTTAQSVLRLADGSWRIWYSSRPKPPFAHKYFAICTAHWTGP